MEPLAPDIKASYKCAYGVLYSVRSDILPYILTRATISRATAFDEALQHGAEFLVAAPPGQNRSRQSPQPAGRPLLDLLAELDAKQRRGQRQEA